MCVICSRLEAAADLVGIYSIDCRIDAHILRIVHNFQEVIKDNRIKETTLMNMLERENELK